MTVGMRDKLVEKLPKAEIVATSGLVEQLRLIKDAEEVERLRRAVWQAEKAFAVLRSTLRPEMTEKEAADELEHQFRLFGAKNASFPSIVAVGALGALPHAVPTQKRIGEDDFVLVDWGANEGLYCSDLTRVLVTGKMAQNLSGSTGSYWRPKPGRLPLFGQASWRTRWTTLPVPISPSWFRPPVSPRTGTWAGIVGPRGAAVGRQEPNHPAAGNGRDGRAGHLLARLGRHPHRGQYTGYPLRPRSADPRPKHWKTRWCHKTLLWEPIPRRSCFSITTDRVLC